MTVVEGILGSLFPPEPEPLNELRPGVWTRVRGRIVPRDTIASPVTSATCVYYRYVVEHWRQSDVAAFAFDGYWGILDRDEAICEFYLQDEHSKVVIYPERARIDVSQGPWTVPLDLPRGQRGEEALLLPGDVLEIEGLVTPIDDFFDEERGYRTHTSTFVLRSSDSRRMTIRLIERPHK